MNAKENKLKKDSWKKEFFRILQFLLGLVLFSVSFQFFLLPNNLVFGGVTGLSVIFHYLWGIDPSLFVLIGSIFLLGVSYVFLGKEKTAGSVVGSFLLPLFLKIASFFYSMFPFEIEQTVLAVIFGGILSGLGLGLVYKTGFTTGGTDVVNQILHKYLKITIGKAMLITDGIIIGSSIFIFGFTKFMYALVVLYIMSYLTDKVMLGISSSKAFYIVTDRVSEVKNYIIVKMGHGVTIFDAVGGFSKEGQKVLFCVVPTGEYFKLKEGIHEIDPDAFFVVTDAYEVFGGE